MVPITSTLKSFNGATSFSAKPNSYWFHSPQLPKSVPAMRNDHQVSTKNLSLFLIIKRNRNPLRNHRSTQIFLKQSKHERNQNIFSFKKESSFTQSLFILPSHASCCQNLLNRKSKTFKRSKFDLSKSVLPSLKLDCAVPAVPLQASIVCVCISL